MGWPSVLVQVSITDASRPSRPCVIVRSSRTPDGVKLVQVPGLTGQVAASGAHLTMTSDSRIVRLPVAGSVLTATRERRQARQVGARAGS